MIGSDDPENYLERAKEMQEKYNNQVAIDKKIDHQIDRFTEFIETNNIDLAAAQINRAVVDLEKVGSSPEMIKNLLSQTILFEKNLKDLIEGQELSEESKKQVWQTLHDMELLKGKLEKYLDWNKFIEEIEQGEGNEKGGLSDENLEKINNLLKNPEFDNHPDRPKLLAYLKLNDTLKSSKGPFENEENLLAQIKNLQDLYNSEEFNDPKNASLKKNLEKLIKNLTDQHQDIEKLKKIVAKQKRGENLTEKEVEELERLTEKVAEILGPTNDLVISAKKAIAVQNLYQKIRSAKSKEELEHYKRELIKLKASGSGSRSNSESGDQGQNKINDPAMTEIENKLLAIEKLTDIAKLAESSIDYEELKRLKEFIEQNHPNDEEMKKTLRLIEKKMEIIKKLEDVLNNKLKKSSLGSSKKSSKNNKMLAPGTSSGSRPGSRPTSGKSRSKSPGAISQKSTAETNLANFMGDVQYVDPESDEIRELFREAREYLPGHDLLDYVEFLLQKQAEFLQMNDKILKEKMSVKDLREMQKYLRDNLLKDPKLEPYYPVYSQLLEVVDNRLKKIDKLEVITKSKIYSLKNFRKCEELVAELTPFLDSDEPIMVDCLNFLDRENEQKHLREQYLKEIAEIERKLKTRAYQNDKNMLFEMRDRVFSIDEDLVPEVLVTKDMIRRHLLDQNRIDEFRSAVNRRDESAVRRLYRSASFLMGNEDSFVKNAKDLIKANDETDLYNFQKLSSRELTMRAQQSTDRYEVQAILQEALKRPQTPDIVECIHISEERYTYLITIDELESRIRLVDRGLLAELSSYKRPLEEVERVINATLTLLGTDPKKLNSWDESKKIFSQFGPKTSIKKRINAFNPNSVTNIMVRNVDKYLKGISLAEVEVVSQPLGLLYSWCLVNVFYHNKAKNENQDELVVKRVPKKYIDGETIYIPSINNSRDSIQRPKSAARGRGSNQSRTPNTYNYKSGQSSRLNMHVNDFDSRFDNLEDALTAADIENVE